MSNRFWCDLEVSNALLHYVLVSHSSEPMLRAFIYDKYFLSDYFTAMLLDVYLQYLSVEN